MIESLKEWIISICTIVILISAVEMILPSNSIKKYCKFVMGLILMVVIINPLVQIMDPEAKVVINFDDFVSERNELDNISFEEYKDESMLRALEVWGEKLEIQTKNSLREEFPQNEFEVDIEVDYNREEDVFAIKSINVGVGNEKKIRRVKPIVIGKSKKVSNIDDDSVLRDGISDKIEELLHVGEENVKVFSLE